MIIHQIQRDRHQMMSAVGIGIFKQCVDSFTLYIYMTLLSCKQAERERNKEREEEREEVETFWVRCDLVRAKLPPQNFLNQFKSPI